MKIRGWIAASICVVVLVSLLMAGCASKNEQNANSPGATVVPNATNSGTSSGGSTVTINVMRPGDEAKVKKFLEPAAEEFNNKNPGIQLIPNYEGWGGWIQKYPTLMKANTQPEIIFWWDNKLKDRDVVDKLVQLDTVLDPQVLGAIPKSVLDFVKVDNKLMYLPATVDPMMMFYRKDMFEKAGLDPNNPPKTWDELLKAAKTIKEKLNKPAIGVPGKGGLETLQEFISLFVYQSTGTGWLDDNNQPIFNNADAEYAMNFIRELIKYGQPNPTEYARGDLRPLFRDGEVAIIFESAWPIPDFQAKFGKDLDQSPIGIAPPPEGPKGKVDWAGTNGWIITRQDKVDAAAKVLNFIASPEQTYKHHIAYGNAPILSYELDKPEYQYDFWKKFNDVINNWKLIPMIGRHHPTPKAFYPAYEEIWQRFILGQIGAKEALNLAEQKTIELNKRAGIQ